ncbi:LysR family transcriptional regulator [Nisaea acidiphila]|uniref:LysR family transcriptional regulator n=1 Tax=Nisaea acidiphila TaxID=1862145 RepID=A0A9J7ATG1_9PROT|nr:LysR family transcriptional regulator [Nisaea acidiphila]UUX50979.1 LysR family transcriptional regulator [Nisaea acidiphila]
MTDVTGGIEVFLEIVRSGSLSAAARALGVGAPAVSHRLKALERELGVELIARTTRSLDLTPAGRVLLDGAGPAFDEISAAVEQARTAGRATSGTLRLTVPWSAYKIVVAPVLAEFQAAYPEIRLEMSFDEALVDIVREGFHAGFRLGDRLADGMIATRLTPPLRAAYSASPAYLAAHGRPERPGDLLAHKCIRYRFVSTRRVADWLFSVDGRSVTVDPPAHLMFDDFRAVIEAARDGRGIGWSLRRVVEEELGDGRLETVLDTYTIEHPPFYIFYPEQHRRLELLRLFVDFLRTRSFGGVA